MPEAADGQLDDRLVEDFLREVMKIERKYAVELRNARTDRRKELTDYVETFANRELAGEDSANNS